MNFEINYGKLDLYFLHYIQQVVYVMWWSAKSAKINEIQGNNFQIYQPATVL